MASVWRCSLTVSKSDCGKRWMMGAINLTAGIKSFESDDVSFFVRWVKDEENEPRTRMCGARCGVRSNTSVHFLLRNNERKDEIA